MQSSSFKKELKAIGVIYLFNWLMVFLVYIILLSRGKRTIAESAVLFIEFLSYTKFIIALHVLFIAMLLLFWIIRYFIRTHQKKGVKTFFKQLLYRFIAPILLIFIVFKTLVFANANENYEFEWDESVMNSTIIPSDFYKVDGMHRGMSVFGWHYENNEAAIDSLIKANVEWVAVIPFIDQEDETSKTVRRPIVGNDAWSSRDSVYIKSIRTLHEKGLHVQLKPHIWTFNGWRSNITLNSGAEWDTWFDSYEAYVLRYARMAELTETELFCIGTELKSSIKNQPERWVQLISKVRAIYSGKLTYAANWHDEYEHIDFWKELDFIGIQAYFPLTKNKNPELTTIEKGWTKHINKLEQLYEAYDTPILFTEVGYKSDARATIKPWEWGSFLSVLSEKKSDQTQQLAYEALFQQLWHKEWFAGVYIWQWNTKSKAEDAPTDLDFSPRFKPAENTIAKWFGRPAYKEDL